MKMLEILNLFSYPFIIKAMIVGILVSICASLLGVILTLKKYSLIGHGLSDVGFAALSLDIAIGIFSTGSLALGVTITALSKGFNSDVYSYMFGSILSMTTPDVISSIILSIIILSVFITFYNRLFLITCDESFAKACGIHVEFYQFLISFLTAITVVLGMRMMGTLLISSLIIFPAVSAKKIVKSFKALMILSALISVFCFVSGIVISFCFNIPTGASIVLANIALMVIISVCGHFMSIRR